MENQNTSVESQLPQTKSNSWSKKKSLLFALLFLLLASLISIGTYRAYYFEQKKSLLSKDEVISEQPVNTTIAPIEEVIIETETSPSLTPSPTPSITNTPTVTPKVTIDTSPSISLSASPQNNGAKLTWTAKNITVGYKYQIIKNGGLYVLLTVDEARKSGTTFLDEDVIYGITYTYEIRVVNGGDLVTKSVEKEVYQNVALTFPDCNFTLTEYPSDGSSINILWNISGNCPAYYSVEIVYSTSSNPEYPKDSNPYATDGVSASIQDVPNGTYYIKAVMLDNDDAVKLYSQQLVANIY